MKAISLWQSWATLMALGLKKIETRSWPTKYRGPLLIHAALPYVAVTVECRKAIKTLGLKIDELPRGGIIAMCELVDCREITHENMGKISQSEIPFGDYTPCRFMWFFQNVKPFKKIIPFRGRQGLFNVPDEALRVCRVCGCSEFNAGGCAWIEEDLCSACKCKQSCDRPHFLDNIQKEDNRKTLTQLINNLPIPDKPE